MWLRSPPNAAASWRMLLQLQKHLQTELRPFQVRSHVTQKTRTDIKNLLHTKVRYCSVVSESVVICQLTLKMAEEIDFENWRISNFKGLVTLTLDRVIRHTVVHHSSTSTCTPISSESEKLFVDGRTDIWPMLLGRLFGVDLIIIIIIIIFQIPREPLYLTQVIARFHPVHLTNAGQR